MGYDGTRVCSQHHTGQFFLRTGQVQAGGIVTFAGVAVAAPAIFSAQAQDHGIRAFSGREGGGKVGLGGVEIIAALGVGAVGVKLLQGFKNRFGFGAGFVNLAVGGGKVVLAHWLGGGFIAHACHGTGILHHLEHFQHRGLGVAAVQQAQAAGTGSNDSQLDAAVGKGQGVALIFGQHNAFPRGALLGSSGGGKRSGVVLLPLGVRLIKKAKFKFERQHAKNGAVQVGDIHLAFGKGVGHAIGIAKAVGQLHVQARGQALQRGIGDIIRSGQDIV